MSTCFLLGDSWRKQSTEAVGDMKAGLDRGEATSSAFQNNPAHVHTPASRCDSSRSPLRLNCKRREQKTNEQHNPEISILD